MSKAECGAVLSSDALLERAKDKTTKTLGPRAERREAFRASTRGPPGWVPDIRLGGKRKATATPKANPKKRKAAKCPGPACRCNKCPVIAQELWDEHFDETDFEEYIECPDCGHYGMQEERCKCGQTLICMICENYPVTEVGEDACNGCID